MHKLSTVAVGLTKPTATVLITAALPNNQYQNFSQLVAPTPYSGAPPRKISMVSVQTCS